MQHADIQCARCTAASPSPRVIETASMFGLGVDEERELTIVPPTRIALPPGGIVYVTGPSGGGKSTILNLLHAACSDRGQRCVDFAHLDDPPEAPLVDVFDLPLKRTMSLLALAGLADAFVMLRRPSELSDGQRYRLRLAQTMALVERYPDRCIILADEFGGTLDRVTAQVISRNVRRWIDRTEHTFVAATTHDDLLEALAPAVLVYKDLGETIEVVES